MKHISILFAMIYVVDFPFVRRIQIRGRVISSKNLVINTLYNFKMYLITCRIKRHNVSKIKEIKKKIRVNHQNIK